MFAFPGMNAALAGMEEKQDFTVSIEGQEGLKTRLRSQLIACSGRSK